MAYIIDSWYMPYWYGKRKWYLVNNNSYSILNYTEFREEDEEIDIWSKSTLKFVTENYEQVKRMVKLQCKGMNEHERNDIISNVVDYFIDSPDYNIERAYNEETDTYITLESYISISIKHVIKRYKSEEYKRDSGVIKSFKSEDGTEKSAIDFLPDAKANKDYNSVECSVTDALDSVQNLRYYFGMDLYLLIYLELATWKEKSKDCEGTYTLILNSLGISKKHMSYIKNKVRKNEEVGSLMSALCEVGREEAIKYLENYVYGIRHIKRVLSEKVG